MDTANKTALRMIMKDIKFGYSYGKDFVWDYYNNEPFRFPFFDRAISISKSRNGNKIIKYSHFGSSATKVTLKDLEWIITVIFKMSPVDFLNEYIRNDKSSIEEYRKIWKI